MKKRHSALIFIVAMIVALAGCVMLVRNRQQAVTQAKAIVAQDQAGTDVSGATSALKAYAARHMKVNVSYVLKGSYDRAVAEAKAKSTSSSAMYAAAQKACDRPGVDSIRQSKCVAAFIAAQGQPAPDVKLPDIGTYTYSVVGPVWTFDIAGLLFVVAAILGIVSVVTAAYRVVTK